MPAYRLTHLKNYTLTREGCVTVKNESEMAVAVNVAAVESFGAHLALNDGVGGCKRPLSF